MAEEVFEVINEKAFVSSEYPLIIVVRKKSNRSFIVRGVSYYKTKSLWKSFITCIDMHENPKNTRFYFEVQFKCSQTLI